ncbi:glycosyltransferase [Aurantiacibacter xanthus]|uniref:Glycosyltransferase n=1 Tax=Aurantiacibacter xanthus TaxID=1784712 RepID=A0A3A1P258_9SPHN|nr:glycosyltransferase family 2 protein [Aurantiacibacter xanthus]RIV83520.1 glycosyltransferase [Aurantiacibacter xanthus]
MTAELPHHAQTVSRGGSHALLRLAVHADALRLSPARYLRGLWWRLCGKRLRARLTIAPLLGKSPRAYRLWLAQEADMGTAQTRNEIAAPPVVALVRSGAGEEATLASLAAEGIEAHLVPSRPDSTLQTVLREAQGAWVLPIYGGDLLARGAGAALRTALADAADSTHLIYADDDLLDDKGRRCDPHFKPDWNAELSRHFDYLAGTALVRLADADLTVPLADDWPADLARRTATRTASQGAPPLHLREVLYHRRTRPKPQRPAPLALSAEEHGRLPSVSVIVPTRNRADLLRTCLDGLATTDYPGDTEIIVIDNGSDEPETLRFLAGLAPDFARVLRDDGPFNFAALNNRAVAEASGELLCFLNNDIEITDPHWLTVMAHQAMRAEVGAVGAQLLYPDGRIQHAGVVVGIGGGAAHAHRLLRPEEVGYFHRHALPQFTSAVTAACMVLRKSSFLAVGGFDADHFAVSFNDVDLCLRLNARGWQSLYEPRARLVHHESVSRGFDRDSVGAERAAREVSFLRDRWGLREPRPEDDWRSWPADPFHHPALSPVSEQFMVRI